MTTKSLLRLKDRERKRAERIDDLSNGIVRISIKVPAIFASRLRAEISAILERWASKQQANAKPREDHKECPITNNQLDFLLK